MKKYLSLKLSLVVVLFILLLTSVKYVFLNDFLQIISYEKIWVHRVNSIQKLKESQEKFKGVELDLVFNDSLGIYDVNHPPAVSINLTLNEYFKNNNSSLDYWLDYKNLSVKNVFKSIDRLNLVCEKNNIKKEQLIVESPNIKILKEFKKEGYQISYYLHWPGLFSMNLEKRENFVNFINENIAEDKEIYLSSDYKDYEILNEYFPTRKKLFWTTEKVLTFKEILTLTDMLNNEHVIALLIQYNSKAAFR